MQSLWLMESKLPSPRADMRSLHERSSKRLGCEMQACSKHVILSGMFETCDTVTTLRTFKTRY